MRKLNKYIILFFLITSVYAVDKTGTTAAKFLSIGVGSKGLSMGGAYTSIASDATAMYWNPAGLSFYDTKEVYFNHTNWIADISFDYFGVTLPMNNKSILGFNVTSVTMDEMEVTRYGNEETGETFQAADYAIGSTYALDLTDRFSVGVNGKYIQQSIANSHAKGLALDFGTLFITPFGFRLGTSISNFGPKLKMTGDDLLIGPKLLILVPSLKPNGVINNVPKSNAKPFAWLFAILCWIYLPLTPTEKRSVRSNA
jgi:hypothetical protein